MSVIFHSVTVYWWLDSLLKLLQKTSSCSNFFNTNWYNHFISHTFVDTTAKNTWHSWHEFCCCFIKVVEISTRVVPYKEACRNELFNFLQTACVENRSSDYIVSTWEPIPAMNHKFPSLLVYTKWTSWNQQQQPMFLFHKSMMCGQQ